MSFRSFFVFALATCLILIAVDLCMGSVKISIFETIEAIFDKASPWHDLLWQLRIPKVMAALLSGMALSVAGLLMQTMFVNPLASPSILGVSSGASLGIALVVFGIGGSFVGQLGVGGAWLMVLAAFVGSSLVLLMILMAALKIRDNSSLLIIGIMVSSLASALIGLWQYFSKPEEMKEYIMWSMGSLQGLTLSQIPIFGAVVLASVIVCFGLIKPINALLLGEHVAQGLGVNIKVIRIVIIVVTSLLASSVTAFCGPIGFVGIAVPHFTRRLLRSADHSRLLWGCMLLGPSLLLLCDILGGSHLPINIITSLIGAPCIIWILLRRRASRL